MCQIDNNQQDHMKKLSKEKDGHVQPVYGAMTYKSSGKQFKTMSIVLAIEIT